MIAPTSTKRFRLALPIGGLLLASVMVGPVVAQDQNEFPGRRVGGGTRGGFVIDAAAEVALNPDTNLGVTQREAPTLYFAVPATEEPYQVTFYLETEAAEPVYETTLEVGDEAELIGVDDAITQVLWTKLFMEAQGYPITKNILFQDNKSSILFH